MNLASLLLDAHDGERTAIRTPDATLTYAEVRARVNQMAHVLRRQGVSKGDRVLIALPDGPDFVAALFATLKLGAVGCPTNPDVPAAEHDYLRAYTGAKVFLTPGSVRYDAPATFESEGTSDDDVALWLFTSGSTGKPKAAIHRHGDFAYHIERYAKGVLGLRASDVTIAVPRLYFPYATGMNLMFPFAVGAQTVLFPEHPTPERLFELCARFRPTILTTVPTMTAKMLAGGPGDLSSLRLAVTAGEAFPVELHRRWNERFGAEMLDGIGSAEMFHVYISNRPGEVRPGCLGRLVPGYEARVVRADDTDAPDGEPGTLWVRGGSMLLGYHDDPGKTQAVLRDGWVVSGDVFRRDAEGFFFYEGRADDMLKVGGIYVSPVEVENVLAEHPAVAECAVVGYEDEHGLVKPRAFVVPHAGRVPDFDDLAAYARQRLARYKVPRSWVLSDGLPRNDRGKVMRRALR